MNQYDLTGRSAIVTGGTRGIGYAIAEKLLLSGARSLSGKEGNPTMSAYSASKAAATFDFSGGKYVPINQPFGTQRLFWFGELHRG